MIELQLPFRSATSDDAFAMAELVNMAGDGLPLYLWGQLAGAYAGPVRLYQRLGYRELAARPMLKDGWQGAGENWVLPFKSI